LYFLLIKHDFTALQVNMVSRINDSHREVKSLRYDLLMLLNGRQMRMCCQGSQTSGLYFSLLSRSYSLYLGYSQGWS